MTGRGRYGAAGPVLLILFLAAAAAGCSTAQDPGNLVDAQGNHPANFVSSHPSFAGSSGAACTSCHGGDLRGGIAKVSCFSASRNGAACHASGPAFHPGSWLDCTSVLRSRAAWHATAYQDNLLVNGNTCAQCHTPPALDSAPSGKCVRCHFTLSGARVPPGSAWPHGTLDGHSAFNDNAAAKAVCMACHDAHNRYGQEPSCHNCHAPFPLFAGHPASWLDCTAAGWHGDAYKNNVLVNGKTCDKCHTLTFKCTLCHFDISGRRVPLGSSYTHGATDNTHSAFSADNAARAVCVACHETHNRFGQNPVCHNCHAPFPIPAGTHGTGWLNVDNTTGSHGAVAQAGTISCSICHPLTGHPTCTTCHFDANGSRATTGFTHAFNPANTPRVAHGDAQVPIGTTCENCHQTSRIFRTPIPAALSCGTAPGAPSPTHPADKGCHYNAALLDPVLTNPRF